MAKALILFGALTGATAVAASPYDIAHESIVASLEIKIGQNDSPNRLTYYTREELIAQQRPFGGATINLQVFYKFRPDFRDTDFEINACETPYPEVNNGARQAFSSVDFQIARGDYPNVSWQNLPRSDHALVRFVAEGCRYALAQQYLRDYQAGFSTPTRTEDSLDHFQNIYIRAKFSFATGQAADGSAGPIVTAYSPALNLNAEATGNIRLETRAAENNFYNSDTSYFIDDSGIEDFKWARLERAFLCLALRLFRCEGPQVLF